MEVMWILNVTSSLGSGDLYRSPFLQFTVRGVSIIFLLLIIPTRKILGLGQVSTTSTSGACGYVTSLQFTGPSLLSRPLDMEICMLKTQGRWSLSFSTCFSISVWLRISLEIWPTWLSMEQVEPDILWVFLLIVVRQNPVLVPVFRYIFCLGLAINV